MVTINRITDKDVDLVKSRPAFDHYQRVALKSALYLGRGEPLGLIYTALKLNGEAGEFAEHVGKAMRDDCFGRDALTKERRLALAKELGDQLWYISAAAHELGYTLSEIALINLQKLADRTARGKLQGSGDER